MVLQSRSVIEIPMSGLLEFQTNRISTFLTFTILNYTRTSYHRAIYLLTTHQKKAVQSTLEKDLASAVR